MLIGDSTADMLVKIHIGSPAKHKFLSRLIRACVVSVLVVLAWSCDESLPPRVNPSNLFTAQVSASYNYTPVANNVLIDLIAVNKFDETISNRAGIEGTIVITSLQDTSVHKTFTLSRTSLIHGNYNLQTGTLTIDPGDTVVLQATWDFTDDAGTDLTQNFFHYNIDATCRQRLIASPESFTVEAKAKLYTTLGYAYSQTSFTIQQYNIFVGPHDCTPL